jgi:hypothetical protein
VSGVKKNWLRKHRLSFSLTAKRERREEKLASEAGAVLAQAV